MIWPTQRKPVFNRVTTFKQLKLFTIWIFINSPVSEIRLKWWLSAHICYEGRWLRSTVCPLCWLVALLRRCVCGLFVVCFPCSVLFKCKLLVILYIYIIPVNLSLCHRYLMVSTAEMTWVIHIHVWEFILWNMLFECILVIRCFSNPYYLLVHGKTCFIMFIICIIDLYG